MNQNSKTTDISKCVHCHICRENCSFLRKYNIDIGDVEKLNELSYHCFLCGTCSYVCPAGIDGRNVILELRRGWVEKDEGASVRKEYKRTISEKQNYLYKNYRHVTEKSVLFPGCNFPSVYPKTTKRLVEMLEDQAGIGVVYDCCGKPISDLGMRKQEDEIVAEIEKRMKEAHVTELITVCPNCYDYLKPKMSIKVVNIYEKLKDLGLGKQIDEGGRMFTPCPDREEKEWLSDIESFFEKEIDVIKNIQCCGLGGQGGAKEPQLAKEFASELKNCPDRIYTYCGSCVGQLTRNGCKQVSHVLPQILETYEKPDTVKSLINRMKTKYL